MAFKSLFIIVVLLSLLGCRNKGDGDGFSILLGQKSIPEYSEVKIGDIFGSSNSLIAYNESNFGRLSLYKDNEYWTEYNGLSPIIAVFPGGFIEIKGNLTSSMYLYVCRRHGEDEWLLIEKYHFEPDPDFIFKLQLP
jgi:hypothetical protein